MTRDTDPASESSAANGRELIVPVAMSAALTGICEVFETMFGAHVTVHGKPRAFCADGLGYGLCLSLLRGHGSWELGLFGEKKTCENLATALLGLSPDEQPQTDDVVDLLGEVVNMVSGIVKSSVRGGADIHFGIPLQLLGDDCKTYEPCTIQVVAQPLTGPDFEGEILLVWSERDAPALAGEVAGHLAGTAAADSARLGHAVSLCEEFEEYLADSNNDSVLGTSQACSGLLMDVINENFADPSAVIAWTFETIRELANVLKNGRGHLFVSPDVPEFPRQGAASAALVPEERDEETLETFSDFLQESEEGLDAADQTLMRLEGGAEDPESVNGLFRVFHSIKGLSSFLELNEVTRLAHTTETLLAMCREDKMKLTAAPLDVTFEATEMMRAHLEAVMRSVEAGLSIAETEGIDALVDRLEAVIRGEEVPARGNAPAAVAVPAEVAPAAAPTLKETVKIAVELVNRLAASAETLASIESTVSTIGEGEQPDAGVLAKLAEATAEVRTVAMLMQMVSLATLFQKMTRMVRDLSKKTGKLARLTLAGEDTMVARKMMEKLGDPLVHMIRNAVDHGVEESEVRKAKDKPPLGTIQLSACYEELDGQKNVVIELADDGNGLNVEKLIEKAVSKGILEADAQLADEEAYLLIFAPGFSTAAEVTAISGRGVGMDVVRKNIEGLGGSIRITSTYGQGSTFRITIPETATAVE